VATTERTPEVFVMGRLAPGATLELAQAQLSMRGAHAPRLVVSKWQP
jgi:hypothetical protein